MAILLCLWFLGIPSSICLRGSIRTFKMLGLGARGNPIRKGPNTQLQGLYAGIRSII